jgi:hypothetical protein
LTKSVCTECGKINRIDVRRLRAKEAPICGLCGTELPIPSSIDLFYRPEINITDEAHIAGKTPKYVEKTGAFIYSNKEKLDLIEERSQQGKIFKTSDLNAHKIFKLITAPIIYPAVLVSWIVFLIILINVDNYNLGYIKKFFLHFFYQKCA